MSNNLDPNKPLPVWKPRAGQERDPERIDLLVEQLRTLWRLYPAQRLGQLLVNLCDSSQNPLFSIEDHVVSQRICDVRDTGIWPPQLPPAHDHT
jgi:hypothetical protein